MGAPIHWVDAFASEPFTGNPAAICVLDRARPDAWMQALAAELKASETAFLLAEDREWRLRWFTPTTEVDLCGHATLAAAHVLMELRGGASFRFRTRSGTLVATARGDRRFEMEFPALDAREGPPPPGLLAALGVAAETCAKSRFDWIVEVRDEGIVRAARPDLAALAQVDCRGAILTARGVEHDFVSRCFYPRTGVPEDPVTGSAHCALAPWWGARLGKREMTGFQASARGGVVGVRVAGDRVVLSGGAVTLFRGTLG